MFSCSFWHFIVLGKLMARDELLQIFCIIFSKLVSYGEDENQSLLVSLSKLFGSLNI